MRELLCDRAGTTRQVGSLVLGVYDSGNLVPARSVGTGFESEQATALKAKLAKPDGLYDRLLHSSD